MLSNEGIFAMNMVDINFTDTELNRSKMKKKFIDESSKILMATISGSQNRKDKLQKLLLSLLNEFGYGNKVGFYEAVVTPSTQAGGLPVINWIKRTLDANNNLVETPC
jgi:hypothetical protein